MSWRAHATGGKPVRRKRSINKDGTPRKDPVDWEGQEQAVLIRWLYGEKMRRQPAGELYDATYHVPNGGVRSWKTAKAMKCQGTKSGVSDLVVMDGRGGHLGLYIEFKATPPKDSALADSQRDWLALADNNGYLAVLARGIEEAKAVLREYASWPPTEILGEVRVMEYGTDWRR